MRVLDPKAIPAVASSCLRSGPFTAEQIEKAQIFDLRELTKLSPGMTFQSVGGNGPGGRYNTMPDERVRNHMVASMAPVDAVDRRPTSRAG